MNNLKHQSEWDQLLKKTEEDLLYEIGVAISSDSLAMLPKNKGITRARAEAWLIHNRVNICSSPKVRAAVDSPDVYIICAAVADALGGAGAATAAVLIFKRGLEKLCKPIWTDTNHKPS